MDATGRVTPNTVLTNALVEMASNHVLPKDLMELQLGQVELLMAMYASDDELSMDDASRTVVESLRDWCASDATTAPDLPVRTIVVLLTLALPEAHAVPAGDRCLKLELSVPLTYEASEAVPPPTEPPRVGLRVIQPPWLSKTEATRLAADIPDDDLFAAIEQVNEAALDHLSQSAASTTAAPASTDSTPKALCRVWFYFPSISTRSKRDDLIVHGPGYGLTGFLLAGKPGVLCLEGDSARIDQYMKFIKTESWGDIPAHHKKVSERYRETGSNVSRAFSDMQEITDLLGERRGERANRGDMKALEAWLGERGLGDAFAKVLI